MIGVLAALSSDIGGPSPAGPWRRHLGDRAWDTHGGSSPPHWSYCSCCRVRRLESSPPRPLPRYARRASSWNRDRAARPRRSQPCQQRPRVWVGAVSTGSRPARTSSGRLPSSALTLPSSGRSPTISASCRPTTRPCRTIRTSGTGPPSFRPWPTSTTPAPGIWGATAASAL